MNQKIVHKKWILIAEDDHDARSLIKDNIEEHYHGRVKVVEAVDGVAATAKLAVQAFDLIITDLHMPNRGGQRFIEFIKKSAMNESTPIIVLTGFPDKELLEKYKQIECIEKPYSKDVLTESIDKQFKLGRLDKRVGAEIINTLLQVCSEFVNQIMKSKATIEAPNPKNSGAHLEGDIICCMNITTAGGACRLGLGFNKELVDSMISVLGKNYELPREKIVDIALKVIFKLTSKWFYQNTGEIPKLNERVVFSDQSTALYKEVTAARGIIIPIQSNAGCLYAHALYL